VSSVMIDEYLCKISFASEPRFILTITNTTLHQLNIPALDYYYCLLSLQQTAGLQHILDLSRNDIMRSIKIF